MGSALSKSAVTFPAAVKLPFPSHIKLLRGAHGHCDGQVLLVVHDGHTIAGIRSISACGLLGSGRVPVTTSASSR